MSTLLFNAAFAAGSDEKVMLNFVNSDIETTVKAISLISGKNFIVDPRVKGTINIVSTQPVSKDLVYPILQSALRQAGYSTIQSNGVIKIQPEADSKALSNKTLVRGENASGEQIITQIFNLNNESANQMSTMLRPLASPNSLISAYQSGSSNTIVITDYADNVRRLARIIDNIDQPKNSEIFTIKLLHASALDVAQNIARLMPEVSVQNSASALPTPDGVRRSIVVPDPRGNRLMIRALNAAQTSQLRNLISQLDEAATNDSTINVIYLRNAEATKLAATLKGLLTGQDDNSSTASNTTTNLSSNPSSTIANTLNATSAPLTNNGTSSTSTATTVQVAGATVRVQADSVTNSLIITAPQNVYNNLRAVIDKLDVRRNQIYVEAMIAEVNLSKLSEFGFQWIVGGGNNKIGAAGVANLSTGSNTLGNVITNIINKTPAGIPMGLTMGLFNGDPRDGSASLGLIASALQSSGNGNVLSTPNLLMLDNEEAKITVGQNIPIVTGTQSSTGSNPNPFTTVERKDIGIKLRVRPQVSEGGIITMTVYQEVSSIDNTVNTQGNGLATKQRTIETKVLVDDGQIVVLGGLIEDRLSNAGNQVPGLGDIPLLGELFKYENRKWEKVNLMVFLRPVLIKDTQANSLLTNDRYQYLRKQQGDYKVGDHWFLQDMPKVQLPANLPEQGLSVYSSQPAPTVAPDTATPAATAVKPAQK
ncbi:type II secretion system secretin GspD [Chitinibacter bivalviorum]|uniref:Type II secretion system secretin GspD n=1 Tax=Chitinibacter bivalviorum TaxID=2739434 RepID=A0A7H9BLF5_9NEIS|nr:type II secretion system secretin GspD [Chitinibacter bivalviorum]QLG89510.1 type II secretion system secretin GspD [Chitinibacter bivalviorum]